MSFVDIIDPALDSLKRLLNLDRSFGLKEQKILRSLETANNSSNEFSRNPTLTDNGSECEDNTGPHESDFDLDVFVRDKLSLDVSKSNLDTVIESF